MDGASRSTSGVDWLDLTSAQLPIWLDLQSGTDARSYIIGGYLRISGAIDPTVFRRAVALAMGRNDALRLRFHANDPRQCFDVDLTPPVDLVDLSHAADGEAAFLSLVDGVFTRGFDVENRPLFHFTLAKAEDRRWFLLIRYHHLMIDGLGICLMIRAVAEAYSGIVRGDAGDEISLFSYRRFVAEDAAYRLSPRHGRDIAYWLARFRDLPEPIFPLRRLDNPQDGHAPAVSVKRWVDWSRYQRFLETCRGRGATPFHVLVVLVSALLARTTRRDDITIGVPILNRPTAEFKRTIGMFAGMMPLRLAVDDSASVNELVERVGDQLRRDYRHQRAPIHDIHHALGLARAGRRQLFDVALSYEKNDYDFPIGDAHFQLIGLTGGHELNPLALYVREYHREKPVLFEFAFNARHLTRHEVEELARRFELLFTAYFDDDTTRIDALPLLSGDERREITQSWNATTAPLPPATLPELFAAQAARTPDAIAVSYAGSDVSYRELDARSNRLARRLIGLGVGPESVIGLCLDRSIDLVVAMLGVLKAGGCYLPLDPGQPAARLSLMLGDAGAALVLTTRVLSAKLPATPALYLDDLREQAPLAALPSAAISDGERRVALLPEHLAYVIYTSGSTGTPKGVGVSHRAIVNHTLWLNRRYELGPDDRVLQKTSIGFDASVWEFLSPLTAGARIVLAKPDGHGDAAYLAQTIATEGVTVVQLVPSLLPLLLDQAELGRARSLRLVLCGGEALPGAVVERFRARRLGAELHNLYGPTEATIDATSWPCAGVQAGETAPLGRPISNMRVYVLDDRLEPVPPGMIGEIYLGGVGLARGYVGRSDLTAERFVADPFGGSGGRLYRTGDLGRWRADGVVEFVGRSDGQVKLRGVRIEPGEIEAALLTHGSVSAAAVVVRDERLVAYVVGRTVSSSALREHVGMRLPAHMVPTSYVWLEALPRTSSGKLDRAALPQPIWEAEAYAPPQGAVEELLAGLWAELLGVERVGRHDNFFALGGDSILSIQLVARARAGGLELTPREIFHQPTLATLAEAARVRAVAPDHGAADATPTPLTPIQHWFVAQHGPLRHFNQAILLQTPPKLDAARLDQALAHVVAHHGTLRLRVFRAGATWRQVIEPPDELNRDAGLVQIDLAGADPATRLSSLEEESARLQAALDPVRGPVWKAAWFDFGDSPGRLLLAIHHLAVDAVSWRILVEDIVTAYEQLDEGQVLLPARTTGFQTWAHLLAREAYAPATVADLPYWQTICAGATQLRRDRAARAANRAADADHLTVELDAATTQLLLREAPRAYRTQINDVLLTALGLAIGRWQARHGEGSPGSELVIDLEGHGREESSGTVDLSRSVGWFTTIFPVRLDWAGLDIEAAIAGGAAAGVALKRMKERLRAVPHKGLGFGLLSQLNSDTAPLLAAFPARELAFNYLGQFDQMARGDWRLAEESPGPMVAAARTRPHLVEVNALVKSGALRIEWSWCRDVHDRAAVAALAEGFLAALHGLVGHCLAPGVGGHTPSDFPLARLTQDEVETLERSYPDLESAFPLSPSQQGLLFHALYDGDADPYRVQLRLDIEGSLDAKVLHRAWQYLLKRHEALRVAILDRDSTPLQIVRRSLVLPWREEDWSALGEAAFATRLADSLAVDHAEGFDFATGPLLRVALFRRAATRWVVVITNHHLLFDGWSLSVLLDELLAVYARLQCGRPPLLTASRPYGEYLAWLSRQDQPGARAYWRQRLAGAAPLADLLPRAARPGQGMGERRLTLSPERSALLRAFVRRHGLTLGALIHGAWAFVLARCSGQADVVFGTTVAGRPGELAGIERMVGLFISTLPLRASVEEHASVVDWLRGLHSTQLEDQRHFYASLAEIQGQADNTGSNELFQTLVVVENYPLDAALQNGNVTGAGFRVVATSAIERTHYPVTLIALPGDPLAFHLSFDRALVDEADGVRLLGHFDQVLQAMMSSPEVPVSSLGLLSQAERREITEVWNGSSVAVPSSPLPVLFAAQVLRTPDAVAVSHAGAVLSYRELDARSNRLARRLIGLGVGAESVVGLCLDRSIEFVVAVLGVLKAGGCYLPLDPGQPAARLSLMLGDAGAALVLTTRVLSVELAATPALYLDDPREQAPLAALPSAAISDGERRMALLPEHLAYIIYTSGSTGMPKGVAVSHRSLTNKVATLGQRFGVVPDFGYALLANPVFDPSVEQLAVPLAHGGRVVIVDERAQSTAASFWSAIADEKVQLLNCVPAFLATMIEGAPSGLRLDHLVLGGEAFPASLLARIRARLDVGTITNLYGPTEATVDATGHVAAAAELGQWLPIGSPLPNYRVYVLDDRLEPVPPGVIGEIYLGGVGLARGYVGRSDLTAERFVADPFGGSGGRLYRTGDLGRWRADGVVEFVGRSDGQVKLRGVRIEPGEIEAALLTHGSVSAAAVVVRDERLVAYVVGQAVSSSALREHLGMRLPGHMVPTSYVWLEGLPRTSSGKLDRAALPEPGVPGTAYAAPQGAVEELLAGVWAELLGVERVGRHDNFFDLGGHSLLATRLVSRLRRTLGVDLPLRSLFEHPTVAGFAVGVSGASPTRDQPLRAQARPALLPLSHAQQRLWFMEQLEGGASYTVPLALRLEGPIDVAALRSALAGVIERHEALRTCFPVVEGSAVQSILPASTFALSEEDVRDETALRARLEAFSRHRFDLSRKLPIAASLLRLGADDHVLAVVVHHIAFDGWSSSLLLQEMGALYRSAVSGGEASLPALPVQYADYALWQREHGSGSRALDYWKTALAGAPAALSLPTDHPRPGVRRGRGGVVPLHVDGSLAQTLRVLSRREGVTMFMVLQAALAVVLSRWSGQEDVLIGTPVANRTRHELEGLIGFFVNTLVLRTRLEGDPTTSELLSRVREMAVGAYSHQDLPFEQLVEALQPVRSLDRSPLFQVMLVLQNAPAVATELAGLQATVLPVTSGTSKYDLTLSLMETEAGLDGALEYDADLFEASTAARLLEHLARVLRGMASSPALRVSSLPLLSGDERREITQSWNATTAPLPPATLPELFAAQAARTPDAIAVSYAGSDVSYRELDARSNRLARRLIGLGVGPESVIGLCLDRSIDLVVAMLGVLKAGGCYLPLDPGQPAARLSLMLGDAGAALVLTTRVLSAKLPATPALYLDDPREQAPLAALPSAAISDGERRVALLPEHLAYVIYTSGSTGTPKGVGVSHRAIVNHTLWLNRRYELGPDDRVLQKTSIGFDASVWEFLSPLTAGARIVLAKPDGHGDAAYLAQTIATEGVTVVQLVPSLLPLLLDQAELGRARSLRLVLCGGEALPGAVVERFRARRLGAELHNLYGPTEATIDATSWPCAGVQAGETAPLGRPISNMRVYVLDDRLEPVPPGMIGEIYLGGVGLARGYVGRSDLTAERFVADPFGGSGGRLYWTGDLGRWRADGVVEFVGRSDGQVKLRGVRIEPGEIEAALLTHGSVSAAAVVVRDERLVAYVVGRTVSSSALREHLGMRLPGHMVPTSYVWLEALPRTSSGKLDRAALPQPIWEAEAYAPPQGAVEELLAGLWAELLGVERVGRHDNFFDLGGHSLLATRLVSRLRGALGVELPVRALFEAPTVASLAGRASRASPTSDQPIGGAERPAALPLSYAQQRLWFLEQLDAGPRYTVPVALRLEGPLDVSALRAALAGVVERHEALRTCFPAVDGIAVQSIRDPNEFALAAEELSGLAAPARDVWLRARLERLSQHRFDLSRDLPIAAALIRLGPQDHVLAVVVHHITFDGWSAGIFLQELSQLYGAALAGIESGLPPLRLQYADFAVWQRKHIATSDDLDYWKTALDGAPEALSLPTDRARTGRQQRLGATVSARIDGDLGRSLQILARREGATLFMVLQAALAVVLGRWSGQDDVLIGTPVANRTRRELEDLIGFFVNTLVLRTRLDGDPTTSELLARVREAALGGYAHQDLPFVQLVEALQPARSLDRSPLFQVMLALQNAPEVAPGFSGLRTTRLPIASSTAKFDLTLSMTQTADGGLTSELQYDLDLFDESTVLRLLDHLERVLRAMMSSPEVPVSSLGLLSQAERREITEVWNGSSVAVPSSPLPVLFAAQVLRTPDAVAVSHAGAVLSYRELDARSNRLARRLIGLGVGAESVVGLCLDRSIEFVVAVLGVLKAGGCYLPLDPGQPAARLSLMLGDAGAALVLTTRVLSVELAATPALYLDDPREQAPLAALPSAAISDGERRMALLPEHLAYIIYTSGSTGMPKGVAVSHRSLTNKVATLGQRFGVVPDFGYALLANPVFDPSVEQLAVPLAHGGRVVIVDERAQSTAASFWSAIADEKVQLLNCVPAFLATMIEGAPSGLWLDHLVLGGEAFPASLLARIRARLDVGTITNLYGPTEATVDATGHVAAAAELGQWLPIGSPLPNYRVYVLDDRLEPVPPGVIGEIYLGGVGLARGYVGRSDLTAERFVADPFGGSGGRLYRTGDLGRWRADGVVEFVGRSDGQVKLRGVRIEPGEIEAALLTHGSVSAAAVVVRDERLVAYVVGQAVSSSALREHLGMRLPGHMVPTSYVWLEGLPRTSSGKLDRAALPEPGVPGTAYAAPQGAVEELLAGVWAELLGVERVGRHDNFFDLGGHSLLATRLVSRLRRTLGVDLPLRSLFEHPTVAGFAVGVSGASPTRDQPLRAQARPALLPLSHAQQRLWFMEQLEGGASYTVPLALRLEGPIDVAALRSALAGVIERHEALRTCFPVVEGSAVQSILPASTFALSEEDVRDETALRARLEAFSRHRFDLSRKLPIAASLLRLGADDHVLAVVVHHIAFDGWSSSLLLQEMGALYRSAVSGGEASLPALPVQYADYALWQREHGSGSRALDYWKTALAGAPAALSLPTDHPRPGVRRGRGGVVPLHVDGSLAQTLRVLSRREGVTMFMVLQAALAVVLSRWSGQEDVLIGTPVANRTRHELEGLIGFFVNTLVLRTRLEGDPTTSELLSRVREMAVGAYSHQDLPFEQLVEALQPVRSLDRSPLFQVMLVLQNAPAVATELAGLQATVLPVTSGTSKYDLTLSLMETEAGLDGALEYDADLFEASTAARLLEHLARVLRGMASSPALRVSSLPLLSGDERREITQSWNATTAPLPPATLPELFAAQAARTPDAIAVSYAGSDVSYRELDARSNRLARRLIGLGVGPESVIGLCLDRSIDLVVAMLGVLKAGGCYLPLDPGQPAARLSLMLGDAGAALVLTTRVLSAKLPATPALYLDDPREQAPLAALPSAAISDGERRMALLPEHLAYVIYTSGSTGTPKGVMVQQRGVVNLALAHIRDCDVKAGDRLLQHASAGFDVSVAELWMALLSGATLILAPAERLVPGEPLGQLLADERVTHVLLVASILASLPATALAQCRTLVVGGEPCPPELVGRWSADRRMVNAYGPTEATVCALMSAPLGGAVAPPLGRPISNTRVYVLDDRLEPVPPGVIGEIYLGGVGLARGYVGRSDLTAERFVADPFGGSGGRLYRTGDLGRWRADGVVEFVGRSDGQVKLRGVRIEPGEIEAALLTHGSVSAAAVVVRDERLVAYVVGQAVSSSALREHLGMRLPGHMVPTSYVWLEGLPRTSSGKLDRAALPEPGVPGTAYAAPQGAVEELLAGVWAGLLGVERVGRHDNFFDLGGHSLLATRLVSRLRRTLGVDLPLRSLFEHPTVAGLAVGVSGASPTRDQPLRAQARPALLPLSHAQQRLWFMEQLEGGASYTVPLALRLEGPIDVAALRSALAGVIERHEALRTCFPVVEGSAVQSILPASTFALSEEDVRDETALRARLEAFSRHRFDLSRKLPIAASLLRLGADDHVLAVVVHHIAFDGWSSSLLLQEMGALYRSAVSGGEASLPALPVQYADYALWQREHGSGSRALDYWKTALAGAPAALSLPTDHPRPGVRRGRGGVVPLHVDGSLAQTLRVLSRREGVTMFMVLQAALAVVLSRWSGQEDVLIGTPVANRTRHELEGLIGFFVNTLVLRTRLEGDPTTSELLSRVREMAVGAYSHQDLPFEQLVEALQPVRSLDRSPLFQVMLVLQNAPAVATELAGLQATVLPVTSGTSKYDLTLSLMETEAGLDGALEYDADLFEASTAARLLEHLARVLRGMASSPALRVSSLPLLSGDERREITQSWNATTAPLPPATLPELFAAQAARTPDAIAVSYAGSDVSYRELDARSNRLARRLIGLGVGPESVIGLCLDRSIDLVVAMLGVLKAGGCYLPLDPGQPAARLSLMLGDAGAALVLTTRVLSAKLPATPALYLDDPREQAPLAALPSAAISDGERRVALLPEHLAYVIYTSGSTGTPKGVMVQQRGVVNLALAHIRDCDVKAGDRLLQHASAGFDVSVAELWMALLSGATLILAPAERLVPGEPLGQLLADERVTHVLLVASILASLPATALAQCRTLVVGGEPCPPELVGRWSADRRMVNAYGPTEATVCALMSAPLGGAVAPPLGRPISNTRVYVLDDRLEPVPPGVIGEIYLGGVGLARGYVGRSDLTAERFVADPFGGSGGRLYRTGDLGRWRADGVVEFVGRSDGQVKLRGVRIEPGEIEAALLTHGSVSAAAVVVRDERLVAYVVGQAVSSSALREHLGMRLPGHMVPTSYVWLEGLPRTSSGKLDRAALPEPGVPGTAYAAPQGAVEELLAGVWAELLGVERVGRHDNFFDLGGHSLLAVQFIHRHDKISGANLPLRSLFEHPTVALLASALGQGGRSRFSHLVPIQHGSEQPALFCIHPAGGAVFCYLPLAAELGREQMVYGLQAKGLERGEAPARSVEEMANDYVAEIRAAQPTGPYHLLGWSFGGLIAYEIACRLQVEGQEVALLALLDTALWQPDADVDAITDASIIETLIDVLGLEKIIPGASLAITDLDSFVDAARHSGVWPADFSATEAARIVELFKINVRQSYAYAPRSYRGRVVLFRAMQNSGDNDRYFDWSGKVAGELAVVPLSCTHNHVPFGPNAADIAGVLRPLLQAARRPEP